MPSADGRGPVVAAIQMTRRTGERRYNVEHAGELIREAAAQGAEIVALPELFSTGYFPAGRTVSEDAFALAEPIPGPTTDELGALATELGVHIVAPLFELDEQRTLYFNSAAVIAPHGLLGTYRKRHIPALPHVLEKYYFTPGDLGYPVFDMGSCKLGVAICYDRHFPETFRLLALRGAQLICCVNSSSTKRSAQMWFAEMSVTASSNGVHLLQTNACGEERAFPGLSALANPHGAIVAQLDDAEGVLVRRIDLDEIAHARRVYGAIRDVRLEDFGPEGQAPPTTVGAR